MTVAPASDPVGKLFGSCNLAATSLPLSKQLLREPDVFISSQSTFDRQSRVGIPLEVAAVSVDVYLAFVAGQVMEWTKDEISALRRIVDSLGPKLDRFDVQMPSTVYLVKTTGKEEGYAAYTRRDDVIVIPANMTASLSVSNNFGDPLHPAGQDAYLEGILNHEIFHIISKNNPSLRQQLYGLIHYSILENEIILPDTPWGDGPGVKMRDLKITNPDGPKLEVMIEMEVPSSVRSGCGKTPLVPVLLSSKPYAGGSFFDSLEWWFIAVRRNAEGKWIPAVDEGGKEIMIRSESVIEQYKNLVGRNFAHEIFHPDEVMAQTFVLSTNQPDASLIGDVSECLESGVSA